MATNPGDFATSDANGSLNVILRDTTGTYVAAGGGGGGGAGDASAANQVTGNASLAAIDTNAGATADAAVTTNTTGTVSGKLRGLVKLMIDLIAKTPALGTAGSAATDVITVQGIASGTAQAISGTVTANAGTGTLAVSGPLTDTQIRATALPVSGTVTANAGTGTLAVSAASLPLPAGAATSAAQTTAATSLGNIDTNQGALADAETSSGNGSVIAILKRVRTLLAGGLPAALAAGGGLKIEGVAGGVAAPASQSGTWTVQPGNTANTTAWKVDGSAVTQPVSGTVTSTPTSYSSPVFGELQGVTSATQLPTVTCKMVQFVAAAANTGKVYLGGSGVTKVDGTTDTTTGLQLSPGQSSGWWPITNLNLLYRICDNTTDHLTYAVMN